VDVFDPAEKTPDTAALIQDYQRLVGRRGLAPAASERLFRTRPTIAAAMLLHAGRVDGALVGGEGDWWEHFTHLLPIIPHRSDVRRVYAMSALILSRGTLFFADTHVNPDPSAADLAELAGLAAEEVRRFGIAPKAALLSHSNFGASRSPSAKKMREALILIRDRFPDLEIDGEMHGDAALTEALRERLVPDGGLSGTANLLIHPNLDAANIAFTLVAASSEGLMVGPILLGMSKPVHVLTPTITARGITNLTAIAAAQSALHGALPDAPPPTVQPVAHRFTPMVKVAPKRSRAWPFR
jgi:malate dehydrogenase (oxaloacetate-decarboxylating)(NADP+)